MQTIKNITAHPDYREAVAKLDSYREALTDARQLADKLDCERVAHDVKDFEPNAIELADRLLSGVALQDNLSKRITETARKIEALRRAIELQQREVLRIRGEHSRRVCRDAVGEHVARVARVARAVEEMHAANRDEQELRATIEAEGYSSTLLPAMAFLPRGEDYFDTRDVDGGMPNLGHGMLPTTSEPRPCPLRFTKSKPPVKLPPHQGECRSLPRV